MDTLESRYIVFLLLLGSKDAEDCDVAKRRAERGNGDIWVDGNGWKAVDKVMGTI